MWQLVQFPFPLKNCSPAAASPGVPPLVAAASAAAGFSDMTYVTIDSSSGSDIGKGGMPRSGMPFRIRSRTASLEAARGWGRLTILNPRAPPVPSSPWQLAQRAWNCLLPDSSVWACALDQTNAAQVISVEIRIVVKPQLVYTTAGITILGVSSCPYGSRKTSCFLSKIFHKQRAKASAADYNHFTEPISVR